MPPATHNHEALTVEVLEDPSEVRVTFRGRSAAREPGQFLIPILRDSLQRAGDTKRPLVLDFSSIDYMNSSTFTPLVKLLDEAARGGHRVLVEFAKDKKWQSLSFAALRAFETSDGRVSFRGK
ncbi:MAG: hypothetical protein M3Y59_01820 [Myxococcota bacterium]|nr:hypothetical protein [Myxococcota bacterium]